MLKTTCNEKASHRAFWPGCEPIDICQKHVVQLRNVAAALGFYCHTEPVDDDEVRCAQKVPAQPAAGEGAGAP
jgi:hypothetical protein